MDSCTWVVVKIMVPFLVLCIMQHLVFRGPKRGPWFGQLPTCSPMSAVVSPGACAVPHVIAVRLGPTLDDLEGLAFTGNLGSKL